MRPGSCYAPILGAFRAARQADAIVARRPRSPIIVRMSLRIPNVARPAPVTIIVAGGPIVAHPGESLAAALIAAGHWRFGEGEDPTRPRTAFCMMGVCQQCLLRVDGRLVQACLTPVVAGQQVTAA